MEPCDSRRRFVRVNVGPDHWVHFHHQRRHFQRLPMANLSVGGCCVRIPPGEVEGLDHGAPLSMLRLQHPNLPNVPLLGRITWIMGKQADCASGIALLGIEFVNPNPDFILILGQYVTRLLAETG